MSSRPKFSVFIGPSKESVSLGDIDFDLDIDIFQFVHTGDLKSIKIYVNNKNVIKIDKWGRTPLHFACRYGYLQIAKILVENGADVNAKDNDGYTPLSESCDYGFIDIVKYLVEECSVDVNTKDKYKSSPVHTASFYGRLNMLKILVDNGAYLNRKDKFGYTPLDKARSKKHTDIVNYIKKKLKQGSKK